MLERYQQSSLFLNFLQFLSPLFRRQCTKKMQKFGRTQVISVRARHRFNIPHALPWLVNHFSSCFPVCVSISNNNVLTGLRVFLFVEICIQLMWTEYLTEVLDAVLKLEMFLQKKMVVQDNSQYLFGRLRFNIMDFLPMIIRCGWGAGLCSALGTTTRGCL